MRRRLNAGRRRGWDATHHGCLLRKKLPKGDSNYTQFLENLQEKGELL